MDFDEWFGEYDEKHQCYPEKRECFEAGQQSKQAEIDVLKNLIDKIVGIVREADLSDGDSSLAIVHDKIQELLK